MAANPPEISISVQPEDFDCGAEYDALRRGDARVGGVATFVGLVRDCNDGEPVSGMTLEHYPGMTEKALADIAEDALRRWTLYRVRVIHRIGALLPTDQIVFVGVTGAHRGETFAACEFIMDFLKTRAPFWKREDTPDGSRWVDARDSDDSAASRWQG